MQVASRVIGADLERSMLFSPSTAAVVECLRIEDATYKLLLVRFLSEPDRPFDWQPLEPEEVPGLRKALIGGAFVADPDDVARVSKRLVESIITVGALYNLATFEGTAEETDDPVLDPQTLRSWMGWARTAVGDVAVYGYDTQRMFRLAACLVEENDVFARLDLVDKALETAETAGFAELLVSDDDGGRKPDPAMRPGL